MNGKKLYRIKNGAMLTGVCNGLAAYFNADVSLVRLAVVVLCCCTGIGIIPYIAAAIILPELDDAPFDYTSGGMNNGNVDTTGCNDMNRQTNENGKDII